MSDFTEFNRAMRNSKMESAIERHQELLSLGVKVQETDNGFLVNDKFLVGKYKNRWSVKGRENKWYNFRSLRDFVKNYVEKG